MGKGSCPGEVLNSAADVILTHSAWSVAQEWHAQLHMYWLLQLFEFVLCSFCWSVYSSGCAGVFTVLVCLQFWSITDISCIVWLIFRYVYDHDLRLYLCSRLRPSNIPGRLVQQQFSNCWYGYERTIAVDKQIDTKHLALSRRVKSTIPRQPRADPFHLC